MQRSLRCFRCAATAAIRRDGGRIISTTASLLSSSSSLSAVSRPPLRRSSFASTITSSLSSSSSSSFSPSSSFIAPAPSKNADPTSETRPFQILGLQQIAVGSLTKTPMTSVWMDVLGLEQVGHYVSGKENVDEDIMRLGPEGSPFAVEVDLMTPVDPEKSPKVHSPALNHIGLWVDDLPIAVDWMKKKGVRFTPGGIRKGASGYDVTFIHPKGKGKEDGNDDGGMDTIGGAGVLIELVQAPPDVIAAFAAASSKK